MVRLSKRMQKAKETVDRSQPHPVKDAIAQLRNFPKTKFDETVELHFHLNIDPKSSDQLIRGTTSLPHGTGKKIRVAVFAKGDLAKQAQEAGADFVGSDDLIDKVSKGFLDFDRAIATPDMMRDLSKLGRVLGPRGLMPSPKSGTVTNDIEKTVKEVKAGKIEYKTDKLAGIHVAVGKRSFSDEQLTQNVDLMISAIKHARPAAVKGIFIKSISLTTTMGPGIRISA